jgi:predicted alpha/beta-hydrolase family hydrolase
MQRWTQRLSALGEVEIFDYDYMREGRKRPDPLPQLLQTHRQALAHARARTSGPIFLIGKSMGGRIGCHVSLQDQVNGLVCLGYPLCGGGDRSKLRDQVLLELRTPILFVQGTRDPLCPLELLESVQSEMTASNFLHVVDGGDHSLLVAKSMLKSTGATQDDVDQMILKAIANFTSMTDCSPSSRKSD